MWMVCAAAAGADMELADPVVEAAPEDGAMDTVDVELAGLVALVLVPVPADEQPLRASSNAADGMMTNFVLLMFMTFPFVA